MISSLYDGIGYLSELYCEVMVNEFGRLKKLQRMHCLDLSNDKEIISIDNLEIHKNKL